ncbi:Nbp2 h [Candida orthopsilosis Co 90-125]|uniref:Nbp2 h n=1 Tax=Candida orthopsilosis (strain 90-125) TaxID=1136231 RepID=H8X9Y3_CANO9|nr:Nbp2 h [Candida orthopsilosis Co 90-125]CCG24960.1 Nbp2 h [Candida orthopsilosis Co 90-125]
MSPRFPPNTKIKDFGYPESHPLHFTASIRHLRKGRSSSDYEASDDATSSDNTSTTSSSVTSERRSRHHGNSNYEDFEGYDYEAELEEDEYGDDDDEYEKDEINCEARAIFDFQPENDNEIGLLEGQVIWISYRHGQGWLVAEDPETGENGLVPEEYVELIGLLERTDEREEDVAKPFLPEILRNDEPIGEIRGSEDEWVDTDEESLKSNVDITEDKTRGDETSVDELDKSVHEMKI